MFHCMNGAPTSEYSVQFLSHLSRKFIFELEVVKRRAARKSMEWLLYEE